MKIILDENETAYRLVLLGTDDCDDGVYRWDKVDGKEIDEKFSGIITKTYVAPISPTTELNRVWIGVITRIGIHIDNYEDQPEVLAFEEFAKDDGYMVNWHYVPDED